MSNWWGQPRSEVSETPSVPSDGGPTPTDEPATDNPAEAEVEVEVEAEAEVEIEAEVETEPVIGAEPGIEPEAEPVIEFEPVATRDGLPSMAQLDALSSELDEIDAALAAMDADPSLPARAATPG